VQNITLIPIQVDIQVINMRKFKHKEIIKISRAQIEAVERQYWSRYNNSNLESMLIYRHNTNSNG
jgi:hypothetical protein